MSFWEKALPLMEAKKIKQMDLVRATGKTNAAVNDWVKKGVMPRADDALKIADYLGVSLRYLITGETETEPNYSPAMRRLISVAEELEEEDIISLLEFIEILKKNEYRKKGALSPADNAQA